MSDFLQGELARAPAPRACVSPGGFWTLGVLLFLCTLSFLDRSILSVVVEPVKADLHLTDVELGLLQGFAFALLYSTMTLPAGWLVDRWSPRLTILFGVMAWSVSTCLCGLAHGFGTFFVGRLGVGVGEAALSPAAFVLISRLFPRERLGLALGVFMIGTLMGGGAALAIGGVLVQTLNHAPLLEFPLLGTLQPWQTAFILLGVPGFALSFLALTLPASRSEVDRSTKSGTALYPYLRRHGGMIAVHLTAFGLLAICAVAVSAWAPTYFARRFHWAVGQSGPWLGLVIGGVAAAGTLAAAGVADWLYACGLKDAHVRTHFWLTLVGVPFGVAAFLVNSPYVCLLLLAIAYLTLFPFGGTATSVLQLIAPKPLRGRVSALYVTFVGLFGGGLGPLVVAVFSGTFFGGTAGLGPALALTMGMFAPLAIILLRLNLGPYRTAIKEAEASFEFRIDRHTI